GSARGAQAAALGDRLVPLQGLVPDVHLLSKGADGQRVPRLPGILDAAQRPVPVVVDVAVLADLVAHVAGRDEHEAPRAVEPAGAEVVHGPRPERWGAAVA